MEVVIAFWLGLIVGLVFMGAMGVVPKDHKSSIRYTEIVDRRYHSTGAFNTGYGTRTIFMIYYEDGTHKAVEVADGTSRYDYYLSYLKP